ncbi:MAG: hypothetical protein IJV16_03225, partial [Lachnospiraceae bacterium]|nr:hypothetical protein [Lachnospiraceae bacterium]
LKSFSDEQNLTFATQEKFWKDFLQDDFDIEEFRAYYNSTENGHVDIEKAVSSGKTIREALTEPYAEYLNNNHFVRHVWTEQEMLDNWHARIDANHKAANAKAPNMPYAGNHVVKNKNEYFAMAKDDIIAYQGAVFMCDRLTDTLTLGDVSDPDKCIRVGLSKGGSLFFNRDNIGSLMDAITMFSPEDQERIVKAIQIDNMAQKAQKEIEDAKSGDNVKSSSEEKSDDLKDE